MHIDKEDDKRREAEQLIKLVREEKTRNAPVSLDDLIELLNADDLRNVVGMVRPKGQPTIGN